MAKEHKAATEITIAQEERSGFAEFVDQYKWIGIGALVAIGAVIVWMNRSTQAAIQEKRSDWSALYQAQKAGADAASLEAAIAKIEQPSVKAVAHISQAATLASDKEYVDAGAALGFARDNAPAIFRKVTFPVGEDGAEVNLLSALQSSISAEETWMNANKSLFELPELPADAPRVELVTDKGKIVVGLYIDRAPQHAKNFIARAEAGDYDGTRFHRIQTGGFIQGGDPNSREDDPTQWGLGDSAAQVPQEDSGLVHAAGALAAAKKGGQKDSSGSQFYITASPQHQFDGNYVVYGRVIEGLELVEEISNAEQREDKAETPVTLVAISKATVLK